MERDAFFHSFLQDLFSILDGKFSLDRGFIRFDKETNNPSLSS
jgi:hypothetical protein